MSQFIVMEASAKVPGSWKYRGGPRGYRKVALVEVENANTIPKMISERARGVVRIVALWDRLYEGKTDNCEYGRALAEARRRAVELNNSTRVRELEVPPNDL